MQKYLALILFLLITIGSNAQKVVTGVIVDQNENPISNVRVQEVSTNNITYSNFDGTYKLQRFSSTSTLIFTHDQFDTLRKADSNNRYPKVYLYKKVEGNSYNLGGFVGYADFERKIINKHLENMPYFLGEADVNRQLQMLPGIEHGREGFSNLYVRGGDVDQNLMLFNGTPIYNYNHLFGISSTFHQKSIDQTGVYKGIAPSRYGGRTSSVINLESAKDNEYSGMSGEIEISALNAGLYFESINKGRNYFTLSARRSWVDLLLPTELRRNQFNFNFYDLQVNFGFKLKNDDQLDFSVLSTRDLYFIAFLDTVNNEEVLLSYTQKWSNLLGSVKYTQKLSPLLNAEHSLHYSNYKSSDDLQEEIFSSNSNNPYSRDLLERGVRDVILRSHWTYHLNNSNQLNFGLQSNTRFFLAGKNTTVSIDYPGLDDINIIEGAQSYQPAFENTLYIENTYRSSENFEIIYGLRNTFYAYEDFTKFVVEPRIHASYYLENDDVIKFAYNRHNQFVSQLNLGESGSPGNLWVPATNRVGPKASNVLEAGYEKRLNKEYSVAFNAFYKTFSSLIQLDNFSELYDPSIDWQNNVYLGSGLSYGGEAILQKNEGVFTGWISYSYGKSIRNFPELFDEDFLFSFDRTHMMKLYANYHGKGAWNFGFNYLLGSGSLFTIPIGKYYDTDGILQLEYNTLNNYRSPFYQRVDISVTRIKDLSGIEQLWKFYLYNAFGSRNPLYINADFEDASYRKLNINRNYLAFVPGVAYIIKF